MQKVPHFDPCVHAMASVLVKFDCMDQKFYDAKAIHLSICGKTRPLSTRSSSVYFWFDLFHLQMALSDKKIKQAVQQIFPSLLDLTNNSRIDIVDASGKCLKRRAYVSDICFVPLDRKTATALIMDCLGE